MCLYQRLVNDVNEDGMKCHCFLGVERAETCLLPKPCGTFTLSSVDKKVKQTCEEHGTPKEAEDGKPTVNGNCGTP